METPKAMTRRRIIIVDDHPLFRAALRQTLSGGDATISVEEAGDLAGLSTALDTDRDCDLVLLDERGLKPDMVARRFAQMSDYERPLGVIVDAGKELTLSAASFDKSASWTYSPLRLTQYFPFAYTPDTGVAGSEDLAALLEQVASLVLKKPPQKADAGTE